MERFRKKILIQSDIPDSVVLDVARNMLKEAESLGLTPDSLTFYIGDIAHNKLIKCMDFIASCETEIKFALFGIKVIRLASLSNDERLLILESNVPLRGVSYLYGRTVRSVSYDKQPFIRSLKHMIKKVIFNDPATIILWKDGTKTVVQTQGEDFDPEKGIAIAIAKKALGNQGNYYDTFKEWLPEEDDEYYCAFEEPLKHLNAVFKNILKEPTIESTTGISKEAIENLTKHHEDSHSKKIDIAFDDKKEAEDVLNAMKAVLSTYNNVTVADYYTLTLEDYKYNKPDSLYGWTNLDEARVESAMGNHFIVLPKVVRLDKEKENEKDSV